jgi:hypothetical protein
MLPLDNNDNQPEAETEVTCTAGNVVKTNTEHIRKSKFNYIDVQK